MLVRSPGVYKTIHKYFKKTVKDRIEHMRSVLTENIAKGEAGLLIMREEERQLLDLPHDIEVFFVMPPAYDDLLHDSHVRRSLSELHFSLLTPRSLSSGFQGFQQTPLHLLSLELYRFTRIFPIFYFRPYD